MMAQGGLGHGSFAYGSVDGVRTMRDGEARTMVRFGLDSVCGRPREREGIRRLAST